MNNLVKSFLCALTFATFAIVGVSASSTAIGNPAALQSPLPTASPVTFACWRNSPCPNTAGYLIVGVIDGEPRYYLDQNGNRVACIAPCPSPTPPAACSATMK